MKFRYLSMGLLTGLMLTAVVGMASFAQQTPKDTTSPVASDTEKILLDKTMGGAIAPQDMEGLEDLPGLAGSLDDRIIRDQQADSDTTSKPGTAKKGRPRLGGIQQKTTKLDNPFAPKKLPNTNKISFGEAPKITYMPGFGPDGPVLTVEDLKRLAMLANQKIDINRLTPRMEEEYGLPAGTSEAINRLRSPRIDGMLPAEFTAKATVDAVMQIVAGRQGEARRKAADAAYGRLSMMADGFRAKKSVPMEIYVKMGVGDAYIEDQKEGYSNGLERVQEAMEALDKIRRGEEQEER